MYKLTCKLIFKGANINYSHKLRVESRTMCSSANHEILRKPSVSFCPSCCRPLSHLGPLIQGIALQTSSLIIHRLEIHRGTSYSTRRSGCVKFCTWTIYLFTSCWWDVNVVRIKIICLMCVCNQSICKTTSIREGTY